MSGLVRFFAGMAVYLGCATLARFVFGFTAPIGITWEAFGYTITLYGFYAFMRITS